MIPSTEKRGLTYKADISRYNQPMAAHEILAFRGPDMALQSIGVREVSYGTDQTELHGYTGRVIHVSTNGRSDDEVKAIKTLMSEVARNLSKPGFTQYEATAGRSNNRGSYVSVRPALLTHKAA